MRYLFILAVGVGAGYYTGFKDGKTTGVSVVQRMVDKVGGSNRGKYSTDVDAQVAGAEQH